MMLVSLQEIEGKVAELAARIGAPRHHVTFGHSRHDGTPHIEIDEAYQFVVCERGRELSRRPTADLDELLYWIFATITAAMASADNARRWFRRGDSRRWLFARQVTLLAKLSPDWAAREDAEHRDILTRYPFRDR